MQQAERPGPTADFLAGDVLKVLDEIEEKPDFIVLDPPRGWNPSEGICRRLVDLYRCEKNALHFLQADQLWRRDLDMQFARYGYRVEKVCCVDMFPADGACGDCGGTTKERYLEILEFTHFVEFFSFNKIGENHKEKILVQRVTVVVALDLGTGNTKNLEYENE